MDDKLIACFISIPKCASKTILNMFDLGINRNNHYDEESIQYIIYENHQKLSVLERDYNLENIYTFTFVRHPYDRIKSWYNWHKKKHPAKYISLNKWIKDGCKTHWVIQNKTNWAEENLSPLLQYNFINGNKKINYIGKIENFESDCKNIISELNYLFKKHNISKQIKYTNVKLNTSSGSENITTENKELIYQMFKKDFDYFNYDK